MIFERSFDGTLKAFASPADIDLFCPVSKLPFWDKKIAERLMKKYRMCLSKFHCSHCNSPHWVELKQCLII